MKKYKRRQDGKVFEGVQYHVDRYSENAWELDDFFIAKGKPPGGHLIGEDRDNLVKAIVITGEKTRFACLVGDWVVYDEERDRFVVYIDAAFRADFEEVKS